MTTKLEEAAREVIRQHSMECLSDKAVGSLREALAEQAEQEPILLSPSCAERGCACFDDRVDGEPVTAYLAPVQPVKQEPVAWMNTNGAVNKLREAGWAMNAAPVRTKDLTDDEILEITKRFALGIAFPVNGVTTPEMFARAVIAADREKNK